MGFNGRENSPPICRIIRYAQEINIQGSPNMNLAKLGTSFQTCIHCKKC